MQSGLGCLAARLKEAGIGTILFTGRRYEELSDDIAANVDLIIDGRFESDSSDDERNLIGSRNQRIIDVSGRYSADLDWFTVARPDYIEVDLVSGGIITNGSAF